MTELNFFNKLENGNFVGYHCEGGETHIAIGEVCLSMGTLSDNRPLFICYDKISWFPSHLDPEKFVTYEIEFTPPTKYVVFDKWEEYMSLFQWSETKKNFILTSKLKKMIDDGIHLFILDKNNNRDELPEAFIINPTQYVRAIKVIPANGIKKLDIPDAEVYYSPDFVNKEESEDIYKFLVNEIQWQQKHLTFGDKVVPIPRLTAWYGDENCNYAYSGIKNNPLPWTPLLLEIRKWIIETIMTELPELNFPVFNSVLLNHYRTGTDSVSWHSDNEKELGKKPFIVSVSFGATRKFKLKHNHTKDKADIDLESGSLLIMAGSTQHYWQHQVPKELDVTEGRINLTFRYIFGD